jgi:hypothetical protein
LSLFSPFPSLSLPAGSLSSIHPPLGCLHIQTVSGFLLNSTTIPLPQLNPNRTDRPSHHATPAGRAANLLLLACLGEPSQGKSGPVSTTPKAQPKGAERGGTAPRDNKNTKRNSRPFLFLRAADAACLSPAQPQSMTTPISAAQTEATPPSSNKPSQASLVKATS